MNYKVASFYKYVEIKNPEILVQKTRNSCNELNILGRILIADEGINGAVCGKISEVEAFKNELKNNKLFSDLTFREQLHDNNAYHKLVIRTRKEIVVFNQKINMQNTGKHISPQQLKKLLDNNEDIILLDARNDYEFNVGRFKNAIRLNIKNFRDLPQKINEINNLKNKKIVMYCTGGIRCEKASAFLKEQGFNDVNQLQGGIINYVNQYADDYFKGACFVFDDRLTTHSGDAVSFCELCDQPCDEYMNCNNLDCDKLFICCNACKEKMNNCCSNDCKNSPRQRKEAKKINKNIIGKVENYYPKISVALVKLDKSIELNSKISFAGKTTQEFEQTINQIKDYNGNIIQSAYAGDLITIPVIDKVRKNDKVIMVSKTTY